MLNPSKMELIVTFLIGLVALAVLWRALLNVARKANRGTEKKPIEAMIWLVLTVIVLAAPALIAWNAPPPIWTWPVWFASACGFFLLALDACWFDGLFPWIKVRAESRGE